MITSRSGRKILGYIFSNYWIGNPHLIIATACPVVNVREPTNVGIVLGRIGSAEIAVLRSMEGTLSTEYKRGWVIISPIPHSKILGWSYIWDMMDIPALLYIMKIIPSLIPHPFGLHLLPH
jgi:hypothetical protein